MVGVNIVSFTHNLFTGFVLSAYWSFPCLSQHISSFSLYLTFFNFFVALNWISTFLLSTTFSLFISRFSSILKPSLFIFLLSDRLCCIVVRVPGYRTRGPSSISGATRFFWEVVGLERGPLSLVSTTEELLGRKSSGSALENRDYGRRDPSRWPHGILYPQKLTLTSPISGGRSRTQATGFLFLLSFLLPLAALIYLTLSSFHSLLRVLQPHSSATELSPIQFIQIVYAKIAYF
jgi:hypothetical protein